MPGKLDRCVEKVMAQGHSKDSAFAICNAAMGESEWPDGISETLKEQVKTIIEEAMSFEDANRILHMALQKVVGEAQYLWIEATFSDSIIYSIDERSSSIGFFRRAYSINESTGEVMFGEVTEVRKVVDYIPVDMDESKKPSLWTVIESLKKIFSNESILDITESVNLIESGETPNLGNLMEKAIRSDGTIEIKVIEPGWGSSGYYPADILERDGAKAFPKGTHMYWNHQTFAEQAERPEGDLRDLAAVLESDARWLDNGREGAGLYADAKVFGAYKDAVNELAPHIGVSIRASGDTKVGEAEGRRGLIVNSINEGRSVDFVTLPGAGGKVIDLFEAKRGLNIPTKETDDMSDKELQEAREQLAARDKELGELKQRIAVNEAKVKADELIGEAFSESKLPSPAQGRIRRMALATISGYMSESGLDETKFTSMLKESIKEESEYLKTISHGDYSPVSGMGESQNSDETYVNFEADLENAFKNGFGLSESAAKNAAHR